MTWHAQLMLVLALVCLVTASCSGKSDACSSNPIPLRQFNELNFHPETCNLKWKNRCTTPDKNGGLDQKPPPFFLCTTWGYPSGLLPVDVYTLSLQRNDFSKGSANVTLHGLWPGSAAGKRAKNQPYGCLHGEEFDENILTKFGDLLKYFWPTNPQFKNTMQCFILSEWVKHGTCAVIPGADGEAFRLSQEAYFRTAFVMANEFNANAGLREQLEAPEPLKEFEPLITTGCVQCAYLATVGWKKTDLASVPRMSDRCIDQCFTCGNDWDRCPPAELDSTVQLDPSNAPLENSDRSTEDASFPPLEFAMPALMSSDNISPWQGTWRSFGAEQLGSGKFEFAQTFTDNTMTVTTDSPYPQTCNYERRGPGELVLRCGSDESHLEDCLVQRLPDIGNLEAAFLACNHTGQPAPASFFAAMDTPGCGNFLMFRCKASAAGCSFSPDAISAASNKVSKSESDSDSKPSPVSHYQAGIAGSPPNLLGSWRSLQVSSHYENGLARWNFTADGQASLQWPNYPNRGVQRYSVSHSHKDPNQVLLASASGTITTCRFKFQYQPVYSYAVLDCEEKGKKQKTQWAMGRCNPCSASCRYSCGPENDICGAGSCDPADSVQTPSAGTLPSSPYDPQGTVKDSHNWCTPQDSSCWPTKTAILQLEQALDPTVPRLGVQWNSYPQPQPAPVPMGSVNDQSFYGLGSSPNGLKALYYYEDINDMQRPCFTSSGDATIWNSVSDMCKASLHQNEYRNWNPFIVVFPLNERHVAAALTFAAEHRLCIATAGTGHEYNSRNSCPTGGILIRTILLKDKTFIPTWGEDPSLAPAGAFRFGAGSIFAEMHNFSAKYDRVIASGWCSTVGMVGFHLGGGHGPFAPSMGLGVDNLLEIEVLQVGSDVHGQPVVHKKIASRHQNPQLFWAMRGGGGGVWGTILSMTIRAHEVPQGGLSRVYITQSGTFCQDSREFGYQWLRDMWKRFAKWQLKLNHKVSTQPAFFINTSKYKKGNLCTVTWNFNFEYFYAGGQDEKDYKLFRDGLKDVLKNKTVQEDNYKSAYQYLLSMPSNKFLLNVTNPLPAPHEPSDAATGSQNSVLVSRQNMETKFASTMMDVLDICVKTLKTPDKTSPDPAGYRCGFHYLYTSMTGNLGSVQPKDTAISTGFRSALMLWNARTLTTKQSDDTIYKLGPNSYFSESSYVMHNWTERYWGQRTYEQLLAVKKAHDPKNLFWCHHCVGDNPNDAYGEPLGPAVKAVKEDKPKVELKDEL
ncbi:6-hydroxy-D-nicotine oxidase [Fusarium beomiforme]|uniref:6-hydroxy-D-nicotine oxidase n=1 Tax=Fusarium beomiforme TaxID=44412 RepID=A0A9P5ATR7_9HYPO|nr:6-hydroxy-D-nicotine oxidase [Fusarium beomiforme]